MRSGISSVRTDGRTDGRRVAPAEVFRVPRQDDFVRPVVFKVTPDPHVHRHEAARPALLGGRRPLGRRRPGPVFPGAFEPVQRRLELLQRQPIRRRRHTGPHFGLFLRSSIRR